ncbi:telomere repeats-binding bouquet formation protein 2 isoform X3 [Trachinotus anak]|uniref:telomere repeats-binding bouquet formation protein 2 isoform X3 n=2 Tax=Trachinotus anak TaxID=443729 RepID=UPI0039F223ED
MLQLLERVGPLLVGGQQIIFSVKMLHVQILIFQSKDYLWNKVTVFQSLFLSTCEKRQSVKSVCIGHYVLPPPSVQDEVRNVVGRLIWECEDEQGSRNHFSCQTDAEFSEEVSSSNCEPSVTDSSEGEAPLCGLFQDYPVSNMLTGYVSMDKMLKYSGDLCDFHPGCFQGSNMHYKESMFKKNKK